jgi:hypothetical protein
MGMDLPCDVEVSLMGADAKVTAMEISVSSKVVNLSVIEVTAIDLSKAIPVTTKPSGEIIAFSSARQKLVDQKVDRYVKAGLSPEAVHEICSAATGATRGEVAPYTPRYMRGPDVTEPG